MLNLGLSVAYSWLPKRRRVSCQLGERVVAQQGAVVSQQDQSSTFEQLCHRIDCLIKYI